MAPNHKLRPCVVIHWISAKLSPAHPPLDISDRMMLLVPILSVVDAREMLPLQFSVVRNPMPPPGINYLPGI
ncbi:hypothetical protein LINPERPRIM_LOCUS33352 [Linum perenne]